MSQERNLTMNIFNQRFARLGFLFILSYLMLLTTAYSRDDQGTGLNVISGKGYQLEGGNQANFQTLYTFTDARADPHSLIQAADGNFYGTTMYGGANREGTLFRLTPKGEFTTLHSFVRATDGAFPVPFTQLWQSQKAGISLLLYGTTMDGGAYDQGTLFVYQPGGAAPFKTAFSFTPDSSNRRVVHNGVVETSSGMFVGTTDMGGTNQNGLLYGYIPDKVFGDTIYAFSGLDGDDVYTGVLSSDGEFVYGATLFGGANNAGTIFKFNSHNKTLETLYSFKGGPDEFGPSGVLLGKDGNLYGITIASNDFFFVEKEATLFRLDLHNKVLTTLISFGRTVEDVIGPLSRLIQGSDGNFYGTTSNGGKNDQGSIYRITVRGNKGELTTLYSWDREVNATTLIQGRDGNLYGVTSSGGAGGAGTIFKLSLSK
jgi:uncharacterized repeat protein (TIGR03803 family)